MGSEVATGVNYHTPTSMKGVCYHPPPLTAVLGGSRHGSGRRTRCDRQVLSNSMSHLRCRSDHARARITDPDPPIVPPERRCVAAAKFGGSNYPDRDGCVSPLSGAGRRRGCQATGAACSWFGRRPSTTFGSPVGFGRGCDSCVWWPRLHGVCSDCTPRGTAPGVGWSLPQGGRTGIQHEHNPGIRGQCSTLRGLEGGRRAGAADSQQAGLKP